MEIVIPSRFNGPPSTGNGGYSCGLLAAHVGASAEVTLRKPPPLDRKLRVEADEVGVRLLDGEALIASARAAEPVLTVPEPPTYEQAGAAESEFVGFDFHHFETCFVCGTKRADGLRLYTGKVADRELVASAWTPDDSVANADGSVQSAVVWSALDCPTYFAGRMKQWGLWAVLGRQTAKLLAPLRAGEPHLVVAWPIAKEGRKFEGGAAVFTQAGELRAYGRGLWIEIPAPA
ncbi:MAG TPA: hotdog fold domain-containing protein [Polyangiales bacterium]|nr:hotdog fold domain-containing protein [Polyangiales bacterium]